MMGRGRGGYGGPQGNQFYKNNFAMDDGYGDEDDMDDYGMDQYYAEEDSDEYAQNYPPGALFQGGTKMSQPMGMGAGSVPFYGQQQKVGGGPMSYGAMGGSAGFSGGMGAFGAPSTQGNGGFTYGMASSAGGLFGASNAPSTGLGGTQFGAPTTQAKTANPGLFQFGKVSQMGGLGTTTGASTFAAGSSAGLFGAAPIENDPYANIAIDLNKVKKQEAPPKLHELKSEEEKKKEAEKRAQTNTKSNLKKEVEKKEEDKKKGVKFGKSTTYEIDRQSDDGDSDDLVNKDHLKEGRGSPRPLEKDKKVIAEKDLSDGRSEKEKILEMLEKQQREQLEEFNQMTEMTNKLSKDQTKTVSTLKDGEKKSIGDSASYDSNDFEDVSMSGSGSKSKLTYWPGKDSYQNKSKDSVSVSQSQNEDEDKYDGNAMEEYLKKQQQKQGSITQLKSQATKSGGHDPSESSNTYEEDFESLSKSQTALTASMLQPPQNQQKTQQKQTFDYKQSQPVPQYTSVVDQYKKRENKFIQTDETKYQHMEAGQALGIDGMKEWTLNRNLKDAQELIQDLRSKEAELKDKIVDLEIQFKKKDVEYQTQRREALNANETSKRLQEQLKDAIHKINLYKIETEELIKQIDLADAKTRNKEDELKLLQAEYERKLKIQEERILFRMSKQEERETFEIKRQHQIEKEEMQRKIEDLQEEIDYFNQKITKVEVENKSLRSDKQSSKRIKELEDEIEMLKIQVSQGWQAQQENINLKNIKNDLSKEDQVKLQRELQQLELMVKGYQEENEKASIKIKQLERDMKLTTEKFYNEQRKAKELHQKHLLTVEKVFIEEQKEELDIDTVNKMGLGSAISQKELQDLHQQLQKLQKERQDYERDIGLKEGQLRAQINKLRDEKAQVEKQLYDIEFLLGDKDREIQRIKDEYSQINASHQATITDLEEKVAWFRQNQKLLTEEDQERQSNIQEITQLRVKVKTLEEENKKTRDLEKKCKLLEETIKSKNPNSIPMLIQAAKETTVSEQKSNNQDKQKISQLEQQLADQDKEFEKKIRALRQEQERIKQMYESKAGQSPDAKRVQELEDELQKTKNYYNKRIREIEDKYKFGKSMPASKPPQSSSKQLKDQTNTQLQSKPEDASKLESQIEQLTKERNLLAQKVVNLETMNNKRRQSFSGIPQIQDEQRFALQAIGNICHILKSQKQNESKEILFQLIESALTCVEQLKAKDPQRQTLISKSLLQLTQDLQQLSQLNERVLNDILQHCDLPDMPRASQLQQPSDLKLKTMHSAQGPQINKDLSGVMDSFTLDNKNTQSPINRPSKPSHPFVVEQKQKRSVKDIIKSITQSGIDLEILVKERKLNPSRVPLNQLYQILTQEGDSVLRTISVDEIKSLIQFVKSKSSFDVELIGQNQDVVDINDLNNVIMDISIELFNSGAKDQSHAALRYSQDPTQRENTQEQQSQLRKVQIEKDLLEQQYQSKIDRLSKMVQDLNIEKSSLMERIEKLENSKGRVERILKNTIGTKGNTLRRTGANQNQDMDSEIIDELSVLMKRIEFLEQQSEEREKQSYQEHAPCKREIMRLSQELEEERMNSNRVLQKKNAEVAYFKAELDALLTEMKTTINNKKQKSIKL